MDELHGTYKTDIKALNASFEFSASKVTDKAARHCFNSLS